MMDDFSNIARSILGRLNREVVPKVEKNGQRAAQFIEKVEAALPRGPFGYSISFIHCGSAYEGLAVKANTDFDIVVMLNAPFESENFSVRRDPSGFFTLEWKSHIPNQLASDCNGFLDASKLRQDLFSIIGRGIQKVCIPNAKIKYREQLVALTVEIAYATGDIVMMDFVPQIVFRTWGQCPDLRPLHELPKCLRAYIDTLNKNKSPIMFFSLKVPDAHKYPNSDQLFNVSFGLLEKKFLASNVQLLDMVRLVKLTAHARNWKKQYKFQSMFVKRIAVKYSDSLKDKTLVEGYKAILCYLAEEVKRGFIDDYFIKGKEIYRWEPRVASNFHREIAHITEGNFIEALLLLEKNFTEFAFSK
ncbi:uncharacterized protein [Palaemon carinicauda]|uniref:uncharacterized protein n=1 Tax=Palaemon carinicauda TaxID=392227 RepID=UPI0035B5BD6D